MNPLSQYLAEATADLTWLTTVPHTIDHIVLLAVEAEGRRRVEEAQAHSGGGGGVSTSGHSDPTGDAAMKLLTEGQARNVTASMDAAIALLGEAATELDHLVAAAIGRAPRQPPHPRSRIAKLNQVVAACIVTGSEVDEAHRTLTGEDRTHLEHIVRDQLAETSSWLRRKGEAIRSGAPAQERDQPIQRAITECRVCSPWRKGTLAVAKGMCQQCCDFRVNHKTNPTEPIVRRWEIGKSATPGMILEAKATTKRKGRKSA